MRWLVVKTVTEYHHFTIEADTEREAFEAGDDNDLYYCDPDTLHDIFIEVQHVVPNYQVSEE